MGIINKVIKGGGALLSAVVISNLIVFPYHRPVGWIERQNSSTLSIWDPNTTLIHGTEGHGIYKVDENGYLNTGKLIDKDYTIAIGASFTQGKEVKSGKRYTDILNSLLSDEDENNLHVYNVSQDGYYFPNIVKGFDSLVHEFPNSKNIIIEIGTTDYSLEEIQDSLNQRGFDEKERGCNIISTLSTKQKAILKIKEYLPIINIAKKQIETIKASKDTQKEKENVSNEEMKSVLDESMKLIRSQYNGRLIICYHPAVEIKNDGLEVVHSETTPMFRELCEKNNIEFVDVSDAFLSAYAEDYSIPYGFWNTTMGQGHFSVEGHRVMAQELFKVLESKDAE